MKIKFDFITNSSSTSFILEIYNNSVKNLKRSLKSFDKKYKESLEFNITIADEFKNKNELDNYTNGIELDWVSKATGPKYENFSEDLYLACKESIENNCIILYVIVDNSVADQFQTKYDEYILAVNGKVL